MLQGTLTPFAFPGLVEPDKPTLTKRGRERAMLCLLVQGLQVGGRCWSYWVRFSHVCTRVSITDVPVRWHFINQASIWGFDQGHRA